MSEMIKDQDTTSEHGDVGRRRLVRGMVALTPLVLTLRSGALAAASCTAVKAFVTTNNGTGNIGNPTNVAQGDICVTYSTSNCASSQRISSGVQVGTVTLTQNQQGLTCGQSAAGKQVAILSATSASSLGIR